MFSYNIRDIPDFNLGQFTRVGTIRLNNEILPYKHINI